jgi:cell division protein FtsB
MRGVTVLLMALLGLVQAELWLGTSGMPRVRELREQLALQQSRNEAARLHNAQLEAEVRDLTDGLEIIEEKARVELGMIRPDEILVQYPPR